jgi:hypothetical protein
MSERRQSKRLRDILPLASHNRPPLSVKSRKLDQNGRSKNSYSNNNNNNNYENNAQNHPIPLSPRPRQFIDLTVDMPDAPTIQSVLQESKQRSNATVNSNNSINNNNNNSHSDFNNGSSNSNSILLSEFLRFRGLSIAVSFPTHKPGVHYCRFALNRLSPTICTEMLEELPKYQFVAPRIQPTTSNNSDNNNNNSNSNNSNNHNEGEQKQSSQASTANECLICLEEFETGSWVQCLPCFHYFHAKCIEQLFVTKNMYNKAECPICKLDLIQFFASNVPFMERVRRIAGVFS